MTVMDLRTCKKKNGKKKTMGHLYNGILLSNTNEQTIDKYNTVTAPQKHYAK